MKFGKYVRALADGRREKVVSVSVSHWVGREQIVACVADAFSIEDPDALPAYLTKAKIDEAVRNCYANYGAAGVENWEGEIIADPEKPLHVWAAARVEETYGKDLA